MNIKAILFISIILQVFSISIFSQRPLIYSKEKPIRFDFDTENIEQPKTIETGYLYDWIDGTLFQSVRKGADFPRYFRKIRGRKKESINVNTFDEVPNSSWFTNRTGYRQMSLEQIRRGPNHQNQPKPGKLIVLRGKTVGATPGFWIKDESGQIFILKFDPPDLPELASGAEIIATKMFYAFGYNVPENYIFRFQREFLVIAEDAKFTNDQNKKVKMTEEHLDLILDQVARNKDGSYRALASRLISGKPIGGFGFSGRRKDDPNDIIPHEIRRDVRALKLFSAWTEHNDIRVGNTLDMFVEEDGRQFVLHYLIDFGSTFGSDTIAVNEPEVGHEYRLDFGEAAKILFTGGVYKPAWRRKSFDPLFSPATGRYSVKGFSPNGWKSNFPLAAFGEMTELDAFWAMQIIAAFTPEQIRAIVETAEFSDPDDTDYLTKQIIARQRLIVQYYSNRRMGIGKFLLETKAEKTCLNFKDYRLQFSAEPGIKPQYEFEIQTLDRKPEILAKGNFNQSGLEIDQKLLQQISAVGHSEENRGIAKLVLKRQGENKAATVYLWAKDGKNLEIAGIVH